MKNNKISLAEGGVEEQGGLSSNIIFSGRVSFQCNQTGCMVSGDSLMKQIRGKCEKKSSLVDVDVQQGV